MILILEADDGGSAGNQAACGFETEGLEEDAGLDAGTSSASPVRRAFKGSGGGVDDER